LLAGIPGILLAVLLAACGDGGTNTDAMPVTAETIWIEGSSTVYPISREAVRRFRRTQRDADIRVTFTGTTAGFERFCAGRIDIADASRAINAEEQAACAASGVRYIELPLATDTLAIVTHADNDWVDHLTLQELRRIWAPAAENRVTHWHHVRPEWPELPLALFGRGQASGTYDYFTAAVVGRTRASRRDYSASEDEEWLASAIAAERGSLGFFGIGAYHRHWQRLRVIAIDSGSGPVYPSLETAADGSYGPLSRPLYLYVNRASLGAKGDLAPFLDAYFRDASRWLHLTGYLPLDETVYARNRVRVTEAAPPPLPRSRDV
jgi:phosphate transport system substrate-binding protein